MYYFGPGENNGLSVQEEIEVLEVINCGDEFTEIGLDDSAFVYETE